MDELKVLVEMVAKLPAMALWVLVGFWAYKVIVIGSIYGVIKFVIVHFVKWRTFVPPVKPAEPKELKFSGVVINEEVAMALMSEVTRLAKNSAYIHLSDVFRLRKAINEMLEKESAK